MHAEIIAIGSELLTPFKQDTNSLFLTEKLNLLGVSVAFKVVVGDERAHLVDVARNATKRSDIVIFMGGLGPTEDDLTRECVAEALSISLHPDPEQIAALYTRFAARRIPMPQNNAKQADLLDGAVMLRNSRGTAPGQYVVREVEGRRRMVILLPGPPQELKPMTEQVMPVLREFVPPNHFARRMLRLAMIPESQADAIAAPIYTKRSDVQTTILASAGEVQLHLLASGVSVGEAQAKVDSLADDLDAAFGLTVYSTEGEPLEEIVGLHLGMRGLTLAVAESCTGGMLGQRLTSLPGSSRWFVGGAIVYSNELKTKFCGVPAEFIEQHGAVSEEVARAMAEGIRVVSGASVGVGVTGIAGPGGATEDKPVGLVYVAVADERGTEFVERNLPGDRELIRRWATQQALDLVRRRITE